MKPLLKTKLVVFDFDGLLIDSYDIMKATFESFGLDIGDEERFRDRRKFLKYLGGGRELLGNLVRFSVPREQTVREGLTRQFLQNGRVYPAFTPLLNQMIVSPDIHVGVVSRNFTLNPGMTIRTVLRNSDIDDRGLDFVIPLPVGTRKDDVLAAMKSSHYTLCLFAGDEIGDYRAGSATGYDVAMASYGFDTHRRLTSKGGVPDTCIHDTPEALVETLSQRITLADVPVPLAVESSAI
ncbi:MAG: HAD family hydrolase [Gammaproteobacteria bacterium]|nr:HAD family hydrolase [Gammaproteobacteria bacterium]